MELFNLLNESFERFSYKSESEDNLDEGEVLFEIKQGVNPEEKINIDMDFQVENLDDEQKELFECMMNQQDDQYEELQDEDLEVLYEGDDQEVSFEEENQVETIKEQINQINFKEQEIVQNQFVIKEKVAQLANGATVVFKKFTKVNQNEELVSQINAQKKQIKEERNRKYEEQQKIKINLDYDINQDQVILNMINNSDYEEEEYQEEQYELRDFTKAYKISSNQAPVHQNYYCMNVLDNDLKVKPVVDKNKEKFNQRQKQEESEEEEQSELQELLTNIPVRKRNETCQEKKERKEKIKEIKKQQKQQALLKKQMEKQFLEQNKQHQKNFQVQKNLSKIKKIAAQQIQQK